MCDPVGAECGTCGDWNDDGVHDVLDVAGCQSDVRSGGSDSCCATWRTDTERDGDVDGDDCERLSDYTFGGAPTPCD